MWALAGTALRADLVLTNYTASRPLKVMASGDSITDDSSINGAWRSYLQPLLKNNGYTFTNLGRWLSTTTPTFTLTRHEGMDGAVIAYPGLSGAHGYPVSSNYARLTLPAALTNVGPDLFLIDLGVNDIGRGRDPYFVATNDMAALLDMIFAKVPAANIIVGKPTSITSASILTPPYSTYGTNSANKYLTTYFRRAFVVPANVLYTNLNLRLNRVDGAIVWLNGREILRANPAPACRPPTPGRPSPDPIR